MSALCEECREARSGWLNYHPTYPIKIASGASYDDSVKGVVANRNSRAKETYDLIRRQCSLIERICFLKHQFISVDWTQIEIP
ncbi:hypothetical protein HOT82_gp077 [Gordonia phage Ronaldo]|uniref:Uncharacterized protein n=4 Tax=Ronaldovirus TaxID=2733205 RepID=A0A6B9LAG2_9CAUD|nr:hypothetical protein HOT81_gp073 [Gordonia phage Fryberger]YP_009807773.1 hypothetical protein HOT82_gp077 [Gordonia phage Ronaldo]QDH48416.1 hypothetical protein SEA_ZIKO_77 [Gordonia phage Ziko]QHB38193.1 hypothetical protein SEA_VOLT_77 [Gordonia phage Volt]AXN53491.1 hypothetical protein SEA_FRYBERGER_73 [Gordonia phage Fryberger]AXN53639.1 hypothetical protein SEA_RONALDO_77 [Gordonia phage Ronaldo]